MSKIKARMGGRGFGKSLISKNEYLNAKIHYKHAAMVGYKKENNFNSPTCVDCGNYFECSRCNN